MLILIDKNPKYFSLLLNLLVNPLIFCPHYRTQLFERYTLNFIPVKNPISQIPKSLLKLIFTQISPTIPLTRFPRPFLNLNLIWLGVGVTLSQIALIHPPRKIPLSTGSAYLRIYIIIISLCFVFAILFLALEWIYKKRNLGRRGD